MPSLGRYTHAIVSRVPASYQSIKTIDGSCIDLERAREQQEDLVRCLRSLNVDVLELPPDEESPHSVFVNDCALVLQGVALACRPACGLRQRDADTVRAVLRKEIGLTVKELEEGRKMLLNASDVLFTGREFFVGLSKDTNMEGALCVANNWPEYPCTPIKLEGSRHLRDRVTLAGPDILSVSSNDHSQSLIKRIEREATHRYKTLTVPEEDAANCLFVNGTLIHISATQASDSVQIFQERVDFPRMEVCISEFQKTGRGLTSICLLVKKSKTIRTL